MLKDIYDFMTLQQSIIFVEMKRNADSVARMMIESGFEVRILFLKDIIECVLCIDLVSYISISQTEQCIPQLSYTHNTGERAARRFAA